MRYHIEYRVIAFMTVHISNLCEHLQLLIKDGKTVSCPYDNCSKYYNVRSSFSSHMNHKHKFESCCMSSIATVTTASSSNSEITETSQTSFDIGNNTINDGSWTLDEGHASDLILNSIKNAIWSVLPHIERERLETVIDELVTKFGVEGTGDLQFVKEEDIRHLLTPFQGREFLNKFKCECPSNWITTFQVPWEKMAATLRDTFSVEQRPILSDSLQMNRIIVDAIRSHCPYPTKAKCCQMAKNVVIQYPTSFSDVTDEGDLLGSGYTSLLNQIKTRVEHV
ncbi:hypothetical protein E1301_Tti013633 [Triplophysa tibetana]|uniref:C2H2-type domain-containing protein n=1 Tax=Triplophysa tibetana TaxID=1572043 RepID=A0A5A9NUA4_9TELE|nr:hypothetical protein E1301_Tti013633 [Triplophysa tibetana]